MTSGLKTGTAMLALLAGVGYGSMHAAAADLGGDCCADLEERIAELEATTVRKGNRKVKLEVSGQVNEALMFWDDGVESNVYQGTNDTARSRVRFKGSAKITEDVSAGYLLEFGVRSNRLNRTDQGLPSFVPLQTPDLRHSTWYLDSKSLGRAWIGLTSQATDGATEVNLANMNHFARASLSKWNGNFDVRVNGAIFTSLEWRDFLSQSGFTGDNVPGEGDRRNLVRYDTPEFAGFTGSAAWGEDDFWDMALRYKGDFSGFKLAAAIGYAHYTDGNFRSTTNPGDLPASNSNLRGCAELGVTGLGGASAAGSTSTDCNDLGLSASVMHADTGLFVTGAYGQREDNLRQAIYTANGYGRIDDKDEFWSVQAGIERKFLPLGKSTFYGEYWQADTGAGVNNVGALGPSLAGFGGAASARQASSEVSYWGIGFNQHVEAAAMDLYVAYRHHTGDVTSISNIADGSTTLTTEFDDLDIVMTGALIKF